MDRCRFSVSMCVYGGDNANNFDLALESVYNQTLPPDEVVLVVDGPVPNIIDEVIKKYEEHNGFKIIRLAVNSGHGEARRIGLENCSNELVALMDSDDISVRDRFEKQICVFKNDDSVSIVGGQIKEFIDSTENVVGVRNVPLKDAEIKDYMRKRCPMNQVTVMFKKSDVQSVGGYIDWYCEEDYYLWIRMALAGLKFANIDSNLVYVRVGEKMYQRRGSVKYFASEAKLQKYMLKNGVINFVTYAVNVTERFVLQVLMPNKLRGWVFQKFARKTN